MAGAENAYTEGMRLAGSQSWEIRWGVEYAVGIALYLRDVLALSVTGEPDLPLLSPSVPVRVPRGLDRVTIAEEWPGWWDDALAFARTDYGDPRTRFASAPYGLDTPALLTRPAIRAAVEVFTPEASRYFDDRKGDEIRRVSEGIHTAPHAIVRDLEQRLGRQARPFSLVVTEVPVAGDVWHRLTDEHVLASTTFLDDHPRSTAALRELLADLA